MKEYQIDVVEVMVVVTATTPPAILNEKVGRLLSVTDARILATGTWPHRSWPKSEELPTWSITPGKKKLQVIRDHFNSMLRFALLLFGVD